MGGGLDRWATRRLLNSGALAEDAAGALRSVLRGNAVAERVAARWSGRPSACPHCGSGKEEDHKNCFWRCPA
eukprot:7618776-Alexandrium_andersonii.AAC.1